MRILELLHEASPAAVAVTGALLLLAYVALPDEHERATRSLGRPHTTLPLLGNTLDIMFKYRSKIYDWLLVESARHDSKPWTLRVAGRPQTVVLYTVKAMEDVLKTHADVFIKGPHTQDLLYDVMGNGIFAADGMTWLHQRKTASHLFSQHVMRENMETTVRDLLSELCKQLDGSVTANSEDTVDGGAGEAQWVDLKRLLDLFTMDIFVRIGFGVDLHGVRDSSNASASHSGFIEAFERSVRALLFRLQQPVWLWHLKRSLSIGVERQLKTDMHLIDSWISTVISQSLANKSGGGDVLASNRSDRDLVSLFLAEKQSSGDAISPDVDAVFIRDMAVNFITAGRDTTSLAMAWFIIEMNRQPHVVTRIRDEMAVKAPRLLTDRTYIPTSDELHELVYLEATIREVLRLHPSVPGTSRTVSSDVTLSDGTFLKQGMRVVLPFHSMARMPSIWGPDATEFKPERWIDTTTSSLRQFSPFQFPTFLAGPRMCLGMRFAYMEMKLTLATLLGRYDFRTQLDPNKYSYEASLTLTIDRPLLVHVKSYEHPVGKV